MEKYQYIIAPVAGYLAAQAIKFILSLRKDGIEWQDLLQSGGFPSAHVSFMVALSTLIGLEQGIESIYFAIIASLTAIIIYDSVGVRKTTGEQTGAIKRLFKASKNKFHYKIHDSKGHTAVEAAAGFILGLIIGFATKIIL